MKNLSSYLIKINFSKKKMKQILSIFIVIAMLSSCGNSTKKNFKQCKETAAAIKEMQPGGIPTTAGG